MPAGHCRRQPLFLPLGDTTTLVLGFQYNNANNIYFWSICSGAITGKLCRGYFTARRAGGEEHCRFEFLNCLKLIFFVHSNPKTQRRASRFRAVRGEAQPFWCLSAVGMSDRLQPRSTLSSLVSSTRNTLRSSRFFTKQTAMTVAARGGLVVVGRCSFWRSLSPQSREKRNIFKTPGCLTLIQRGGGDKTLWPCHRSAQTHELTQAARTAASCDLMS